MLRHRHLKGQPSGVLIAMREMVKYRQGLRRWKQRSRVAWPGKAEGPMQFMIRLFRPDLIYILWSLTQVYSKFSGRGQAQEKTRG